MKGANLITGTAEGGRSRQYFSAENLELGQDPMAGLSGQTSIFDAPAQPEVRADAQAAPVAPKVKKQPAPAARKEPRQGDDGNVAMFSRRAGSTDTEAQRQFKETERAYGGKAAYDRAKAAGKTKLTYGQWVQVRTPNFKAWFGDWEQFNGQATANADRQGTADSGADRRATGTDAAGRGAVRQVWGLDSSTGEPKT